LNRQAAKSKSIMTELWFVGIQSVDRTKREVVIWLMRSYPDLTLPLSYGFFCRLLGQAFTDYGFNTDRMEYEDKGLLPKPPSYEMYPTSNDSPSDIDDLISSYMNDDHSLDSSKFIEHVQMTRWWGSTSTNTTTSTDNDVDVHNFSLQAEYIVRVTHEKYFSCRLDPCFIGHYYMSIARYVNNGDEKIEIEYGRHETSAISLHPFEDFLITTDVQRRLKKYAEQHFQTIGQCLLEIPNVVKQDPTCITPEVYPNLSTDLKQILMLIMVCSSHREDTVFSSHNRSIVFHIFTFLPLRDLERRKQLNQLYLYLECSTSMDFWRNMHAPRKVCFKALHEASMKHFSIRSLLRRISTIARNEEHNLQQYLDSHNDDRGKQHVQEQAGIYGTQLRETVQMIDNIILPAFNLSSLYNFFPRYDPMNWIQIRLQRFDHAANMQEFVDDIQNSSPEDIDSSN
jgi:hypothetical protein